MPAFENAFSFDVDAPLAFGFPFFRHVRIGASDMKVRPRLSFQHQPPRVCFTLAGVNT